uniref:Uncharacterized protein n=1 Tax=Globisporangium ultimum (strain ATCC 200006 / CBS 805.95 / DAOM BR144) TaxID=431595 RepID=K3WLG0_GLOUD
MAAQSSPRKSPAVPASSNDATTKSSAASAMARRTASFSTNAVDLTRRKSMVNDPEELLLLREKLTQIAVGLRFSHNEEDEDEDEDEEDRERRRIRRGRGGHFKVFPLLGDRPSTPPSSPQPRDVLRKQMRLRNSSFRLDDLPSHQQERRSAANNNSCEIPGLCVDEMEITRVDDASEQQHGQQHGQQVCLSIPSHLRARSSSSFSVFNTNPEGMRKRKSVHVIDTNQDGENTPLKKTSSQKNVLAGAWDYDNMPCGSVHKDHEMEDVGPEATSDSPIFASSPNQVSACS